MALDIKDGTGTAKTVKTSVDGSDHVPYHLIGYAAMSNFRSLTANSTAQEVKASAGGLYGFNIINLDTSDIYVKFYNIAAGSVNPASDVPIKTLFIPSGGSVFVEPECLLDNFNTAISLRTVTGSADTSTTAPSTSPIIELKYI